jgi:hypothetical protein
MKGCVFLHRSDAVARIHRLARGDRVLQIVRVHHIEPCVEDVHVVLHRGGCGIVSADAHSTYIQGLGGGDAGGEVSAAPLVPIVELKQEGALDHLGGCGDHSVMEKKVQIGYAAIKIKTQTKKQKETQSFILNHSN